MNVSKCETCIENCPQSKAAHDAALGRMYAMRELAKCAPFWDALCDENGHPLITPDRLRELVVADGEERCVVLPVPMHRTLLDASDPVRPELMKNFRISASWDHCGIVFHSPWNIFLEKIEKGHIRPLNEAVEVALKGELHAE